MKARVLVRVGLAGDDPLLLLREDLRELAELRLRDPLGGERRDRGLDETTEFDDVRERMAARDEVRERPRQVVRRGLPDERSAAGPGLDDPEQLERSQRLADRSPRDLELLGQLPLGRELIARPEVAALEESLDLVDDPLIKTAPPDRLDNGPRSPPQLFISCGEIVTLSALVRWSDHGRQE